MNLGSIYLLSAVAIIFTCLLVSCALMILIRCFARNAALSCSIGILFWIFVTVPALQLFHQPLFSRWHQSQNTVVPADGCLSYTPNATRLYATYRMSREEYIHWASSHPWNLAEVPSSAIHQYDLEKFQLDHVEISYSSPMADDGGQLSTYYQNGIMYLAYYAN